ADSSPLIILAKVGVFDLLPVLYPRVYISPEVHSEVVIAGRGLPAASEVTEADWIEIRQLIDHAHLPVVQARLGIGLGEITTILLAKELGAEVALIDDLKARKLARQEGLAVRGTVGIVELLYRRGALKDIRSVFKALSAQDIYIDRRLLNIRLQALGITPI